jgi:hypothetical protein
MAKKTSKPPTTTVETDDLSGYETWTKAKLIPVDMLIIPEWNVNEMDDAAFARLLDETKDDFDEPVQVIRLKEGPHAGKFLVPGGAHRLKAVRINGGTHIPCVPKTKLEGKDELEIQEWSVVRNNIKGRLNAQKVAELQARISKKWNLSTKAAQNRLLMRQELAESLKKKHVEEDNETTDTDPNDIETISVGGSESSGDSPAEGGKSPDKRKPPFDETDGLGDRRKKFAERRALVASLKACVQEALIESEETVEHGYLYFGTGGQTHLVVNESKQLHALIADMVAACKANSDKVDEFLCSALSKELPQWQ